MLTDRLSMERRSATILLGGEEQSLIWIFPRTSTDERLSPAPDNVPDGGERSHLSLCSPQRERAASSTKFRLDLVRNDEDLLGEEDVWTMKLRRDGIVLLLLPGLL